MGSTGAERNNDSDPKDAEGESERGNELPDDRHPSLDKREPDEKGKESLSQPLELNKENSPVGSIGSLASSESSSSSASI